jgi:hypothetical protein
MSFDALAGFRQALLAKEREHAAARRMAAGACDEMGRPWRQIVLDCGIVNADAVVRIE